MRSSRRQQQQQREAEDAEQAENDGDAPDGDANGEMSDDFLGLSTAAPKKHTRAHVDASFEDFGEPTVRTQATRPRQEDAGSFWDTNTGEDIDAEPSSGAKSNAKSQRKNDGIDSLLDGIGDFFQIKISPEVHDNVRSRNGCGE